LTGEDKGEGGSWKEYQKLLKNTFIPHLTSPARGEEKLQEIRYFDIAEIIPEENKW